MAVYINLRNKTEFRQKWRDDTARLDLEAKLNAQEFDWVQKKNIRDMEGVVLPVKPQRDADAELADNAYQMSKAIQSLKLIMSQNSALDIASQLNLQGELVLYNRNAKRFNAFIKGEELDTNNFMPLWKAYKLELLGMAEKQKLVEPFQLSGYEADFRNIGNSIIKNVKILLEDEPIKRDKVINDVNKYVVQRDLSALNDLYKQFPTIERQFSVKREVARLKEFEAKNPRKPRSKSTVINVMGHTIRMTPLPSPIKFTEDIEEEKEPTEKTGGRISSKIYRIR